MVLLNVTEFVLAAKEILQCKNNIDDFEDTARSLRTCLDHAIDEEREKKIEQGIF